MMTTYRDLNDRKNLKVYLEREVPKYLGQSRQYLVPHFVKRAQEVTAKNVTAGIITDVTCEIASHVIYKVIDHEFQGGSV